MERWRGMENVIGGRVEREVERYGSLGAGGRVEGRDGDRWREDGGMKGERKRSKEGWRRWVRWREMERRMESSGAEGGD